MQIDSNYRDMLQCFVDGRVRFLVVGGYAVIKLSELYNTKDLELWIAPLRENAERTLEALKRFGAPASDITVEDLLNPEMIYQIGVDPVRVDHVFGSRAGVRIRLGAPGLHAVWRCCGSRAVD